MGGNRDMVTWMNNPKVRLFIEDSVSKDDEGEGDVQGNG